MTKSFNVLDSKQKIYGNFFLEASAGTGKTFTIAHLVIRLLVESRVPISITKIATVTFTKAAASELKKRIKDLLIDLKNKIENQLPNFLDAFDLDKKETLHRIKLALIDFDFAPIHTIHGLSYQILKKHALHMALPIELMDPEQQSLEILCYDFIKNLIDSRRLDQFLCKKQKSALLSSHHGDLHEMILSIRQKILSFQEIEPLKDWPQLSDEIKICFNKLPPYVGKDQIESYVSCFKLSPLTLDEFRKQLEVFDSFFKFKTEPEAILFNKTFFSFLVESRLKAKVKTDFSNETVAFVESCQSLLLPLINQALNPNFIELLIVDFCKKEFEKFLKQEKIFSFHSILSALDEKLNNAAIIKLVSQDYEAMIVDEFQDTDPVQWSILQKLCIQQPVKAFYMVGDPKQAIYAFRSADVYTYITAKNTCPNLNLGTLNVCYRSSLSLIQSVNKFLSQSKWIELPFSGMTLDYLEVESASEDINEEPVFSFYHFDQPHEEAQNQLIDLAHTIIANHPKDTVAILVKDRFQAESLETAAKNCGLVCQSLKTETLDKSVCYELILELLIFLKAPLSTSSINRILVSPIFNYTVLDFEKHTYQKNLPRYLALFQNVKSFHESHNFLETLQYFLDHPWIDEISSIKAHLVSYYYVELLDKLFFLGLKLLENTCYSNSINSLILELEKLKKSCLKIPCISPSFSPITIMTTHMSKGLEFDHVIALGISTRFDGKQRTIVKRRQNQLILGPFVEDDECILALHDLDAEKLRQQYVAITRAKKSVHIPLFSYPESKSRFGFLSPLEFYLLKIEYPLSDYKDLYLKAEHADFSELLKKHFNDRQFAHHTTVESEKNTQGYLSLQVLNTQLKAVDIIQEPSLSFTSLKAESVKTKVQDELKGKEYGDFFHMLIETVIDHGMYQNIDALDSRSFLEDLIELSPFSDFSAEIFTHLHHAVNTVFQTPFEVFCLKDIPRQKIFVEEPFSFATPQGVMKGIIDCIVVLEKEVVFIDWKTSFLHDTSLEGITQHMNDASYFLQLQIYKSALDLQKIFFKDRLLSRAYYVFVKHGVFYESNFQEILC